MSLTRQISGTFFVAQPPLECPISTIYMKNEVTRRSGHTDSKSPGFRPGLSCLRDVLGLDQAKSGSSLLAVSRESDSKKPKD